MHAYVVMGNHFHLAVETPLGNLVAGMQWLQSTFANRFNKLRGERGHLFQGRYKALLVEDGDALGQVCHYIHLNPVRAGIVPISELGRFRHGSYRYLTHPKDRPKSLTFEAALSAAGGLPDRPVGWRLYGKYLEWQANRSKGVRLLVVNFCTGPQRANRRCIAREVLQRVRHIWLV
jgi:putative transposase